MSNSANSKPNGQAGRKPNIVFVFADQMRAQSMHWSGDPNAISPAFDRFAKEAVCFENAVSGCPVCCPARASLITGQYPHEHGVFLNDATLGHDATSIAQAFTQGGYDTGYIGKWHLHGKGRSAFIPREERHGFDYWQVRECTHDYWDAHYFSDTPEKKVWEGYDAFAQTKQACDYLADHAESDKPFLLMLSWGPPHSPYETAPDAYKKMFDPSKIKLRENVAPEDEQKARETLAGYYAHIAALDDCFDQLDQQLKALGIDDNTILVYWSDHGDMMGSRGAWNKQRPWDESIRVPLMIRWPAGLNAEGKDGKQGRLLTQPINTPDLMPTLLDLAGIDIPSTVRGSSYAEYIRGEGDSPADAALIACYWPFGQYLRKDGGREFRGVRTDRYTFVRSLDGPWLFYDNQTDPYQLDNLVDKPEHAELQAKLDTRLSELLERYDDAMTSGQILIDRHGHTGLDANGTLPYVN